MGSTEYLCRLVPGGMGSGTRTRETLIAETGLERDLFDRLVACGMVRRRDDVGYGDGALRAAMMLRFALDLGTPPELALEQVALAGEGPQAVARIALTACAVTGWDRRGAEEAREAAAALAFVARRLGLQAIARPQLPEQTLH